jgi:DNA modification methylase
MRKGSVLRFTRPTGRKVRHPTEKPWPLMAELIESSSRADDLVLDPCAGVGSTGVAAVLRGRRTLLIEINEDYARVAADRIRKAERLRVELETI